jgi:hypothetical protein
MSIRKKRKGKRERKRDEIEVERNTIIYPFLIT